MKTRQARVGLSRGRKAAAGVLGVLGVAVLGGAVGLTVRAYGGGCTSEEVLNASCVLPLIGYASAGYTVGSLLLGGSLLTALIPSSESGAP